MNHRILIVEDDDTIRGVLQKKLQACGYQVAVAANGKEGIQSVDAQPYDLVVTDILMPEQDGLEILMHIGKLPQPIKTIAITAAGNEIHLDNAKHFGASRTLTKPFRLDEFAHTVQELLDGEHQPESNPNHP